MTNAKEISSKNWFVTMLLLVAAMVVPSAAWAQEMYTVFDTETGTLTFKYDNSKPESTDTQKVYDVPTVITQPDWQKNHKSSIQKVVFDVTFKDAQPKNCYSWFEHCKFLTTISGIENLNTEEVIDMRYMFNGCGSLTTLDLSGFNTAKVKEMNVMFNGCSQLTTIFVSDKFTTSAVTSSINMFGICPSLVGAIKYDGSKTDATYANFRTGYFSYGIKTADDLKKFAQYVNGTYTVADGETQAAYPAVCAGLMNDITMTENDNVAPIGSNGYTGTFDGRGHSISGLNLTSTNNSLFANNSGGTIKNLGVVDVNIAEGSNGSICQSNSGTIENCFFTGTTEGTTSPGGAVCQSNSGTITNCYYLADSESDAIEGTTAMTAAQFKSGAVAWLLNGSSSDGDWGQQLGTEDYPVLGGAKVYQCSPCTGVYSNDENELTAAHNYVNDGNGFLTCAACGEKSYQPATLNESGEYEIGNAGQLYWFAGLVNGTLTDGTSQNTTAKGVLTDNIDLSGISNWTPIGNENNKFGGTFDGKNFKVQHLSITQQGSNSGLFGYANEATMQNICIDGNVTLTTTSYTEGYGSIAGCVVNSTVSNCHSSVNFTINTDMDASANCIGHIGGIVGKMNETNSTESNVSGCSYSGTINLNKNKVNVAAGIVGYAIWSDVPITNCSFTGTIHSECENELIMGGIFGYTRSSGNVKVTNCLQAGTLEKPGDSSLTGILIGQINTGYGANAITNNYYTSNAFNMIGSTTGTPTTTPATQCDTTQLQSGEICYLLNGSSSDGGWGQQIGTDSYPVPGSDKTVYEVNLLCGGVTNLGKTYVNDNEDVTIAHELPETATFDSEKKIYGKVCQRESCGVHLGYFADAAGTIKAKPNAEATAFTVSSYTLEDATAYDSKAEFIVKSLEYKRTFSHNDWVAVYVPFAIDCSVLPNDVEMVVINNFHEYEQEDGKYNVVLEVKHKTSGTIPALTPCAMRLKPPFIFNPSPKNGNLTPNVMPMNTALTEPVVVTMNFSNAAFSAAADKNIDCFSVERYYKFYGSLAGKEAGSLNDGTDFVLNQGKLNKANENTSLKAQRWYLSATDRNGNSSASIASLRSIAIEVVGESDVTGIEDIHVITEREAPVREGIYDLQGRKLNSEPAEGIYIKNGIKYVK